MSRTNRKTRRRPDSREHIPLDTESQQAPSILRRLGAMLYDWVLLLGVLMLAVMLLIIPYELIMGQPYPKEDGLHRTLEQIYLVAVVCAFYAYFWIHGGQTLGMRAWRFRLVRDDGAPLRLTSALVRLAWATMGLLPLGIGLWWCIFDPDGLTWYDRRSRTRAVMSL